MEEKIREEFCKDWSIDYELEHQEYYSTCIKLIKNIVNHPVLESKEKVEKIKELIEELDYEING